MRAALLDLLRCPHCGDRLAATEVVRGDEGRIDRGVLYDDCAAYPLLDGIAYLRADDSGRRALDAMERGADDHALAALLAPAAPDPRPTAARASAARSFAEAVAVLVPGPEAVQLRHRPSDPVFRAVDHLHRAVAAAVGRRPVLDFGAGAGHLTRGLTVAAGGDVLLADYSFAKLWLATRFLAPGGSAVCCDGNQVLPFAPGSFGLVTSSDAFHYVWQRQLLARELSRMRGADGVLVMTHLHNRLVYNPSAGMPLDPAGYRRLLGPGVRLVPEEALLDAALGGGPIDLRDRSDDELAQSPALAAVAGWSSPEELPPAPVWRAARLVMNPLYRRRSQAEWALVPPTPEYADEYGEMFRYLPRAVTVDDRLLERAGRGECDAEIDRLRRCSVLLDLPAGYQ